MVCSFSLFGLFFLDSSCLKIDSLKSSRSGYHNVFLSDLGLSAINKKGEREGERCWLILSIIAQIKIKWEKKKRGEVE